MGVSTSRCNWLKTKKKNKQTKKKQVILDGRVGRVFDTEHIAVVISLSSLKTLEEIGCISAIKETIHVIIILRSGSTPSFARCIIKTYNKNN